MADASTKMTVAEVVSAMERTGGIVAAAAKILEIAPQNLRAFIHRHPELNAEIIEITARNTDLAESELLKAIKGGNVPAILFYLRTKGKDRGYDDRASSVALVDGRFAKMVPLADMTHAELVEEAVRRGLPKSVLQ